MWGDLPKTLHAYQYLKVRKTTGHELIICRRRHLPIIQQLLLHLLRFLFAAPSTLMCGLCPTDLPTIFAAALVPHAVPHMKIIVRLPARNAALDSASYAPRLIIIGVDTCPSCPFVNRPPGALGTIRPWNYGAVVNDAVQRSTARVLSSSAWAGAMPSMDFPAILWTSRKRSKSRPIPPKSGSYATESHGFFFFPSFLQMFSVRWSTTRCWSVSPCLHIPRQNRRVAPKVKQHFFLSGVDGRWRSNVYVLYDGASFGPPHDVATFDAPPIDGWLRTPH